MRIETYFARADLDGRSRSVVTRLEGALALPLSLRLADVILCEPGLPPQVAAEVFIDPVVQRVATRPLPEEVPDWDWLVEISWKPGVTDTLALTARQALEILYSAEGQGAEPPQEIQTARLFLIKSSAAVDAEALKAAFAPLWNPLVQSALFVSRAEWDGGSRLPGLYPPVHLNDATTPELIDVAGMDDQALQALASARLLALTLDEMSAIRAWFAAPETKAARAAAGLPPQATDVEIEMLAQTWSEHCKHKIFNAVIEYEETFPDGSTTTIPITSLFKTFIRGTTTALAPSRPDLLSVFTDNAGVFRFDDNSAICVKAETHNSPSALDPYGGAITGIVGVNRDILGTGMGAAPLFNTNVLCFAPPATPDAEVPEGLKRPRDLLEGVHRGIVDGGNQSGIPTVAGAFVFDPSFLGKPLVFCGTGGIMPLDLNGSPSWEKAVEAGMLAVMVGGRVGKDGIHGATFSSLALDEGSPASAVQIGDPIIQKRMGDFLLEARDQGLYAGITDNGAGGLSSSLGEMAEASGGVVIDLDDCPRKYAGLSPWEVLVSESQERMSLAVRPETLKDLLALASRRGVEATVVGRFTDSGNVELRAGGATVGLLSLAFLHDGLPTLRLKAQWSPPLPQATELPARLDWEEALRAVLADPDVASKEALVRQYDHEVKGLSVEKPFTGIKADAPSDGAVLKPRYDSWRGLAVAHGVAPRLSELDPGAMAAAAVDEAYRAYIALGGEVGAAVALDNFCWPDPVEAPANPGGARKLGGLVRACATLKGACLSYNLPLVSGKDSMKNDALVGGRRISVKPTLLVTVVGPVDDVRKTSSTDFLAPGHLVYLLGRPGGLELGASIFERAVLRPAGPGPLPAYDFPGRADFYARVAKALSGRLLRSIHDLSDGGLAVALVESCLGGRLGATLNLEALAQALPQAAETEVLAAALFGETPGRYVVSVRPQDRERLEASLPKAERFLLGEVVEEPRVSIRLGATTIVDASLADLEAAWKSPIVPGQGA